MELKSEGILSKFHLFLYAPKTQLYPFLEVELEQAYLLDI